MRGKLTLLIEGIIVMLVVVTGFITTMRELDSLERELRKRGLALTLGLAKVTARPLLNQDLATLRRFITHTKEQDYVLYVYTMDREGKVVMHSDLNEVGKVYRDKEHILALKSKEPGYLRAEISPDNTPHYDVFAPIEITGFRLGTVWMGYSDLAVEKERSAARQQIFLIGVVTIILGGLAAYLLATFISSPVKKITAATKKVAEGDLVTRLTIERNDEIGVLADSFNKMTENLQKTTISKNYVDNIIGSMINSLIVLDTDAVIRRVNKATCDLLGYDEKELVGKDITTSILSGGIIFRDVGFQKLLSGKQLDNLEVEYIEKNGGKVPMLLSAGILRNSSGEIEGLVVIARDITERKHAEEGRRQSQKELRFLSSQLLTAQERERRRLSVELHDELGQSLMVLKLKVGSIQRLWAGGEPKLKEECDGMLEYINVITENVRRLSRDLSPSLLEDLGLTVAVRKLVKMNVQHSSIDYSLDIVELDDLFSPDDEIMVYRIIQECLTNIEKHAKAKRVEIVIKLIDNEVLLCITDDGRGFDEKEAYNRDPSQKGLGLSAMHERARILGGSLHIWSQKDKGTITTLMIPVVSGGTLQ